MRGQGRYESAATGLRDAAHDWCRNRVRRPTPRGGLSTGTIRIQDERPTPGEPFRIRMVGLDGAMWPVKGADWPFEWFMIWSAPILCMKTALFLGAGASAFASQPTTVDLLELLRDRIRRSSPDKKSALQEYAESLVDAGEYDDVEKLYDGIQAMIDVYNNPNCKPITEKIRYYDRGEADVFTYEEITNELKELRSTIRDTLLDSFKIKPDSHKYIGEMYDVIRSAINENRSDALQVFTTNYDQVVETYAKARGYETINGFEPPDDLRRVWADVWERNTDKSPLYLTKLHGSINWYRDDGAIVEIGGPARRDADNDILVAPTMGAKRYDGEPFSALMGRFRDVLRHADVLLVIGFSYRDDEIVRIIRERLSEGMALISVSPTAADDIRRLFGADVRISEIDYGMDLYIVDGSRVFLCDQRFVSDYGDELRYALKKAYELIRQQKGGNAAPQP